MGHYLLKISTILILKHNLAWLSLFHLDGIVFQNQSKQPPAQRALSAHHRSIFLITCKEAALAMSFILFLKKRWSLFHHSHHCQKKNKRALSMDLAIHILHHMQ